MVYYKKKDYVLYGFEKSKVKNKKYNALIVGKDKKIIKIPFGSSKHAQFKDKVLGLYSHLDHGDKDRRRRYRARHKVYIKPGYYSPGYFSLKFLWT